VAPAAVHRVERGSRHDHHLGAPPGKPPHESGRDIDVQRYTWGSRVAPLREPGAPPYNTRAVIDACRPFERLAGFPRVAETSRELRDRVPAKWPDVLG
jgi:4-hydroxy-3-polyprenylbenzoate decarboxylase